MRPARYVLLGAGGGAKGRTTGCPGGGESGATSAKANLAALWAVGDREDGSNCRRARSVSGVVGGEGMLARADAAALAAAAAAPAAVGPRRDV